MRISNVEITEMVAKRGYDYSQALDSIDAGRTPEDAAQEITEAEVNKYG